MPESTVSQMSARWSRQSSPKWVTEIKGEASTPRRVIGFAPSSTCSTPPPSILDYCEGEEQMISPFGVGNSDMTQTSGFAAVQISGGFNNAAGLAEPPSPTSRQASALTSELQGAVFESAMHRLRSLRTGHGEKRLESRRVSVPTPGSQPLERATRSASVTSSAMNIPLSSRAHTAPDQLPELTESMVERLLSQQKENGSPAAGCVVPSDSNKTPEVKEMCSPQRRKNFAGKRVPSAKFLNDLNSIKLRQESIDFGEVKRATRTRRTP